jgi:hypothetical protein
MPTCPGEVLLRNEDPDDDAQAEGGQGQEVAAQSQQRQADEQCDEHRRDDRDGCRQQGVPAGFPDQQRLGVGTDGDEGRVSEADLSG